MNAIPKDRALAALLLLLACTLAAFTGCAAFPAKAKYHTAAIPAPSVAPVKQSIGEASRQSQVTSQHLVDIRRGTDRVDYKASRALQFFPTAQ